MSTGLLFMHEKAHMPLKKDVPFAFSRLVDVHVQMGSNYPIQPCLHMLLSGFHNFQDNDICLSFMRVCPLVVILSLMY